MPCVLTLSSLNALCFLPSPVPASTHVRCGQGAEGWIYLFVACFYSTAPLLYHESSSVF